MKQIGRYKLTQKLGEGGMGAVYEAIDPSLNRRVAIKLLPSHLLGNANVRSRFTQEAQTIAQLQHPNIVKILEYGEHTVDQLTVQPYFVMELMEGGSLEYRLRTASQNGQPLPLTEVKRIVDALAPAFDAAHNQNIVHRDVKPGNILFDRNNIPYLADFGIARLVTTAGNVTKAGTPAYMAPEQYTGKSGINRRTDIYQLGITIYQMLTGTMPFDTNTPERAMYNHINVPPPPICQINPAVPPRWETALSEALAKNPADRFPSVSAFAYALKLDKAPTTNVLDQSRIDRQGGVLTPPPSSLSSPPPQQKRPLLSTANVGWLVALLMALGALFFALRPDGNDNSNVEPPIVLNTDVPTPPPTEEVGEAISLATPTNTPISPTEISSPTATDTPEPTPTLEPTATYTPLPTDTATPIPTPTLGIGSTKRDEKTGMVQLFVPAGTFQMGTTDTEVESILFNCRAYNLNGDCRNSDFFDEQPSHEVFVDAFWIDETEITNEQYIQFLNDLTSGDHDDGCFDNVCVETQAQDDTSWITVNGNGTYVVVNGYETYPVNNLSWYGARAFCEWRGAGLPTGAEWEKAARWDAMNTVAMTWPWGNDFDGTKLNYRDQSYGNDGAEFDDGYAQTSPVKTYPDGVSSYGAFDMAGNLWEWTGSLHEPYPYDDDGRNDLESTDVRVLRGGSWNFNRILTRSAYRFSLSPNLRNDLIGSRCAQSASNEELVLSVSSSTSNEVPGVALFKKEQSIFETDSILTIIVDGQNLGSITITDDNGAYEGVCNLAPGEHTLTFTAENGESESLNVYVKSLGDFPDFPDNERAGLDYLGRESTNGEVDENNVYTVKRGDFSGQIVARYNTTVDDVFVFNPHIGNMSTIEVGQQILIPFDQGCSGTE